MGVLRVLAEALAIFLVAFACWLCGFACCRVHFAHTVLRPWFRNITPGAPDFWVRMRDYKAVNALFMHERATETSEPVTFDVDPEAFLRASYAELLTQPEPSKTHT